MCNDIVNVSSRKKFNDLTRKCQSYIDTANNLQQAITSIWAIRVIIVYKGNKLLDETLKLATQHLTLQLIYLLYAAQVLSCSLHTVTYVCVYKVDNIKVLRKLQDAQEIQSHYSCDT